MRYGYMPHSRYREQRIPLSMACRLKAEIEFLLGRVARIDPRAALATS